MKMHDRNWKHTYCLILGEDGEGPPRTIEFEAMGPEVALYMAQQQCRGREAELIEDGRSLGRVQCVPQGGYWRLSPAPADQSVGMADRSLAAAAVPLARRS